MDANSGGLLMAAHGKNNFLFVHLFFIVLFYQCDVTQAVDSWEKQTALNSFNSFCSFNPADNLSFFKILSTDEELVNRTVGHSIEMFCADNVLRKLASAQVTEYDIMCGPFIEVDDQQREILRYYWDLEILNDQCGNVPVCTLMKETYGFPILTNSSMELLHEEPISYGIANNRTKHTMVGFYPVGTSQAYSIEDACGNSSLEVTGDELWSTCVAPDSLAIIENAEDGDEIRTNYWLFNLGLWTYQPPECGLRQCVDIDLVALGFTDDDIMSPEQDYYLIGESVQISCPEGQIQLNRNISSEVITCVCDNSGVTSWERPADADERISTCKVRQCSPPTVENYGLLSSSVNLSDSKQLYEMWETVEITCAAGHKQDDAVVLSETLTCSVVMEGSQETYVFTRADNAADRLKLCNEIVCAKPADVQFEYIELDVDGNVVQQQDQSQNEYAPGLFGLITCSEIDFNFVTECMEPDDSSVEGRWVPTPHCESKTCEHFMVDDNLYEYELQYGRNIIGEPGPVPFNSNLSFVCPSGTVAYGRNQLDYQCRLGPDGYGHFEPYEWNVKPDCRDIRCPRNDTRTGAYFNITYPYYERTCYENEKCKLGMIVSLDCSAEVANFTPLFQCDLPNDYPKLAMSETELKEATLAGVWFPAPSCDRGCSVPVNISTGHDCTSGRRYDRGEWNFVDDFVVECTCMKGYIRDDDSQPEIQCDASTGEWIVIKPCHVDCSPLPDVANAQQNVSYFDTYALMQIDCDPDYHFFPRRHEELGPVIVECHLGSADWINVNLYKCIEINGCTEDAMQDVHPDIYLSPFKEFYFDGEVALAFCGRGYLEGDFLFEVLVCNAIFEEVPISGEWSLIDTDQGPAPTNFSAFHYLPNVTMELSSYEWDYQYLKGNLTCITDYSEHFPEWVVIKDEEEEEEQ